MFKVYGYVNFKLVCLVTTFNEGKVFEIIDTFQFFLQMHF